MARAMASELQCQRVIDPLSFGESVPLVQTVNHLVGDGIARATSSILSEQLFT